ncbi:MAG TPA: hypothetical protein VIH99_08970 [Bdellovibrionota bacterium]|jgi:hypothetical protein
MRLGKTLLLLPLALIPAAAAWYGYGAWLEYRMPRVEIREVTPSTAQADRALPFFELMSPLPTANGGRILPKLEYKKGPPDRYIERITVLLQPEETSGSAPAKERIVYHGRRSRSDLPGLFAFPEEPAREAHYIETALRLSQGEDVATPSGFTLFLLKPLLLREAASWLDGVESVAVMDQTGTPAFLFHSPPTENGRTRATALFIRRNSFYRVDYWGDRGFSLLEPEALFRKTFLTEKREDAMAYVARQLSEVHMDPEQKTSLRIRDIAWPVLLLAANVSVDPSSLDSYFHFAGINALLYRTEAGQSADLEISDALRNNVLASDLYARDVAPNASKTAEISRLARILTRNFD